MKLQGIFVDTTTPFDHAGELYRVKIEHNIRKWNQTSVAGYVIGGFTGEGALLAAEEKYELWKLAADYTGPDKLRIAGVDAAGVKEASAQANRAAGYGFAAALVETPHGDKLMSRQEVQLLYFRAVADRAGIPVLISIGPRRRSRLSADTRPGAVPASEYLRRGRPFGRAGENQGAGRFRRSLRRGGRAVDFAEPWSGRRSGAVRQCVAVCRDRAVGGPSHSRRSCGPGLAVANRAGSRAAERSLWRRGTEARHGSERLLRRSAAPALVERWAIGEDRDRARVRGFEELKKERAPYRTS